MLMVCLLALAMLIVARAGMAYRNLSRTRQEEAQRPVADLAAICVVQPLLGGDPTLADKLAANIRLYPRVRFVWLIDEDDDLAMAAAATATHGAAACVEIIRVPVAPRRQNPKVFKLGWAYRHYREAFVVLDDDCLLAPGSLETIVQELPQADLVTGLPFYREEGTIWSRLLAKFPNGQSILTYFSVLTAAGARTINGMFYATTKASLDRVGGFPAIAEFLCDDYELAKSFVRHGLRIRQCSARVSIFTSLADGRAYAGIMHRWAFFSVRQVSELFSWRAIGLVMLPNLLPLVCLLLALPEGPIAVGAVLFVCWLKTESALWLRRRFFEDVPRRDVALEIVNDFLLPIFFSAGAVSRRIRWRSKIIVSNGEALTWSE